MKSPLQLDDEQLDILTETINIGFGRAAASLSVLVNQHVFLEVPQISLLSVAKLSETLSQEYSDLAAVQQRFTGGLTGDVVLIMDANTSARLVDLLSGGDGDPRGLTLSDREALLEVGNILLNAYIGSFANLMHTQVNFSVPVMRTHSLTNILTAIEASGENQSVLLVETRFLLDNGSVVGHVALIIEASSIEAIFRAIKTYGLQD